MAQWVKQQSRSFMDWVQFILFVITTLGMFFWNRSESRSDVRQMQEHIKSNRELILAVHKETQDQMKEFQKEMNVFHGRMCTLEERYLQIITGKK